MFQSELRKEKMMKTEHLLAQVNFLVLKCQENCNFDCKNKEVNCHFAISLQVFAVLMKRQERM